MLSNKIELLPAQYDFITSDNMLVIYRGGLGAGKTFILCLWAWTRANMGRKVLLTEPTYTMVEDVMIPTFEEIFELLGIPYTLKMKPPSIRVGGGLIVMRSAEKPDRLRGGNFDDFGGDEISYNKDDKAYKVGIGRTRKSEDAQHRFVGTPKGKDWAYKLGLRPNCKVFIQSTIKNKFLPKSYRRNLLNEYHGDYLKQELEAAIVDFGSGVIPAERIIIQDTKVQPIQIAYMCQAFDLGFTEKKKSDYSAYALCGIGQDGRFYILDVERWKFKAPATKEKIKGFLNEIPNIPSLVEANGPQRSVYDDLINDGFNVEPVFSSTAKVARTVGYACDVSASKVVLKKADWNQDFIDENAAFSMDDSHEHDDMLDAVVMCFNKLKYGNSTGIRSKLV